MAKVDNYFGHISRVAPHILIGIFQLLLSHYQRFNQTSYQISTSLNSKLAQISVMPKESSRKKVVPKKTITSSFRRKKHSKNRKAFEDFPDVVQQLSHSVENEKNQGQIDNPVMEELSNAAVCSIDDAAEYLRHFDHQKEFGPCLGIKRSERYMRALHFGLNPPETVILVIRRFQETCPDIENNIWTKNDNLLK